MKRKRHKLQEVNYGNMEQTGRTGLDTSTAPVSKGIAIMH